jgi:adenine-specific DNA-methyltransferase
LAQLARALARLQGIGEANEKPGVITDNFTRWGSRARFFSLRGTTGTRNYFSRTNALFLDGVLDALRRWWTAGRLARGELFLLLTSVLEEVVITANVNGTFHDFNRDRIWPNAHQAFQLRIPLVTCSQPGAEIANSDAIDAAAAFREHDVCYLDPPYNFRQYTAYYHLLNFIAAYPFLEDVQSYVAGLAHVRGQHPEDDFASDFCYRDRFIPSLQRLVERVDAKHVVLSYYGGRNHWNHWSKVSRPGDQGLRVISELFEDRALFSDSEVISALDIRKNYQSRVGEQKELVREYLFHGVLRKRPARYRTGHECVLAANVRWGLADEFRHTIPHAQKHVDELVCAAV